MVRPHIITHSERRKTFIIAQTMLFAGALRRQYLYYLFFAQPIINYQIIGDLHVPGFVRGECIWVISQSIIKQF